MSKKNGSPGFSLIELMIAMVVTLVVTGAVYGLLAGGNNAFKREPERMERQQNARIAMDLMMRDIQTAGAAMPAFIQSFTRGLDACSSTTTSPAGTTRQPCPPGGTGLTFAPGLDTGLPDDIELIGNPGNQEGEATCHYPGGASSNVRLRAGETNVEAGTVVLVFMANGTYTLINANDLRSNNTGAGDCESGPGNPHAQVGFNSGAGDPTALNQPGGLCSNRAYGTAAGSADCFPTMLGRGEIVRYGVRRDAQGVPSLYRFSTSTLNGTFVASDWQLVARGIEDLQVQYRHLDPATMQPEGAWRNEPKQVSGCNPADPNANCCDPNCYTTTEWAALRANVDPKVTPLGCVQYDTCTQPTNDGYSRLVTEVRITLSSRAEAQNIQGVTDNAVGGARLRGSLTQTISPRAALFAMTRRPDANGGSVWR